MIKHRSKPSLSGGSDVSEIPMIGPKQREKLSKLGIESVKDLIYHFPVKHRDTSQFVTIDEAFKAGGGTVTATLLSVKNSYLRSRKVITKAVISDGSRKGGIVWFNQPFLTRALRVGEQYYFELKLPNRENAKDFYCISYEAASTDGESAHLGRITPYYNLTAGITSKWLRSRIRFLHSYVENIVQESLPESIIKEAELIPLTKALKDIHFPQSVEELETAVDRLEFDEFWEVAIKLANQKIEYENYTGLTFKKHDREIDRFINSLPYQLTGDQKRSIEEIIEDLTGTRPGRRVINGDVGSGKTIVVAVAAYLAALNGYSTLMMAPTTVLASQHFQSMSALFEKLNVKTQLLHSGMMLEPTERAQIIVGTHSLLYEQNLPSKVGLVIVDEQHRFGVAQREILAQLSAKSHKTEVLPHYIEMTATPIPRTLAGILYGDVEVSQIKEMPKNRIPIKTHLVPFSKSAECYSWVADKIVDSGHTQQAYIIFPLIDDSESSQLRSATSSFEKLSKGPFKSLRVELLHGRMKDEKKKEILSKFREKQIDILISTTVIEVGIDVADATIILIEGAERYGLAQLHQLRGRVGRGDKESYCMLIPSQEASQDQNVLERLKFFAKSESGFDVAEFDLQSRGPGEVYGKIQSGVPQFKVAKISNFKRFLKIREMAYRYLSNTTV